MAIAKADRDKALNVKKEVATTCLTTFYFVFILSFSIKGCLNTVVEIIFSKCVSITKNSVVRELKNIESCIKFNTQ